MAAANPKRQKRVNRMLAHTEINVVSLIDIFAILVFYLLVNALVVVVIPEYEELKVPFSQAEERVEDKVVVAVNRSHIFVNEIPVMPIPEPTEAVEATGFRELTTALGAEDIATGSGALAATTASPRALNVVADQGTPYHLLKRVLASCSEAGYTKVSLALREAAQVDKGGA